MSALDTEPCRAVLDTHVLLDWLVFRNPAVVPLTAALIAGRLQWIAAPGLRRELDRVAARPEFARWEPDPQALEAAWSRWAHVLPDSTRPAPWRCTDPDDQKFLDLALQAQARWLITRDRALLRIAKRARTRGLDIVTPEHWRRLEERVLTSTG